MKCPFCDDKFPCRRFKKALLLWTLLVVPLVIILRYA